jgi:hypothetical protein
MPTELAVEIIVGYLDVLNIGLNGETGWCQHVSLIYEFTKGDVP